VQTATNRSPFQCGRHPQRAAGEQFSGVVGFRIRPTSPTPWLQSLRAPEFPQARWIGAWVPVETAIPPPRPLRGAADRTDRCADPGDQQRPHGLSAETYLHELEEALTQVAAGR